MHALHAPPSSWHWYPVPLPPLKLKLAEALLLGFAGLALIVDAVRTAKGALVVLASQLL